MGGWGNLDRLLWQSDPAYAWLKGHREKGLSKSKKPTRKKKKIRRRA